MSDDLCKWRVYNPLDPLWDYPPARSALEAKTLAEIIVLRYRDHHAPPIRYTTTSSRREMFSEIAEAIRNIPCSYPISAPPSSPIPATASSKST